MFSRQEGLQCCIKTFCSCVTNFDEEMKCAKGLKRKEEGTTCISPKHAVNPTESIYGGVRISRLLCPT